MNPIIINKEETETVFLFNEDQADLHIVQQEASTLNLFVLHLTDLSCMQHIHIQQEGEHCQTNIYGLAVLKGKQEYLCDTLLEHQKENGTSTLIFKYLLFDEAKGEFVGRLKVQPNAQHTDASQTNRNIVLSDKAKMRTMPQLEIYADDVRCSHGATTGALDNEAIFYMQQRGLQKDLARQLLLQAFAEDIFEKMPIQQQEQARNLFTQRI